MMNEEVQKVLAAVDWMEQQYGNGAKVGVVGYAEGGLVAFYAAAVDSRIDAALVSGYFDRREKVWSEPIYRNVWRAIVDSQIVPQQQTDAKQWILAFVRHHFQIAFFAEPINQAYVPLQRNL